MSFTEQDVRLAEASFERMSAEIKTMNRVELYECIHAPLDGVKTLADILAGAPQGGASVLVTRLILSQLTALGLFAERIEELG